MADKQPLVGSNAAPSAPPPMAPPPYAPPSGGYGPGYGTQPPGYYGAPAQTQTNTTVVVTQPSPVGTVTHIKPPNYIVLSVLNMLFCWFLFGIIALIMGMQSDSAWNRGDHSEAHRLSMLARRWNIIGIVGGFFFNASWVIVVIAVNVSVNSHY